MEKENNDEFNEVNSREELTVNDTGDIKQQGFSKTAMVFMADFFLNIFIVVVLVFLIRGFIITPFRVYGPSMCDTLNYIQGNCLRGNGEYIIINKFGYLNFGSFRIGEPQRGDIIVFIPPSGRDEYYIKRIIGLPGEKVEIKQDSGGSFVYIFNAENPNGLMLPEEYLNEDNYGKTFPSSNGKRAFDVPEGSYFVLGDNRRESSDSRHCFIPLGCSLGTEPFLPAENIEGKAWLSLWPFNKIRVIPEK